MKRTNSLFFYPLFIIFILNISSIYSQIANHIVISEIRYDEHSGVNEEFVELYNPTETEISLDGWKLEYKRETGGDWRKKEVFGPGHAISPYGFFLWGGDAMDIIPDVIESSRSAVGLSNDGGNIRLINPADSVVDRVAWKGGDSPEGSGDAGKTKDGGSLERKASSGSTVESMTQGGSEENGGNGYDSNDNGHDFIVHDSTGVNPQNSQSAPEPPLHPGDGAGFGLISPQSIYARENTDLQIIIMGDSNFVLDRITVVVPSNWSWSKKIEVVSLEGEGFQNGSMILSGDTILVINACITKEDSGIIRISDMTTPEWAENSCFTLLTAVENGNLMPVYQPPVVRILGPLVSIINLHYNDCNGKPIFPYNKGCEVTITGIVTVSSGLFSQSKTDIFVQDSTAGIQIYSDLMEVDFLVGDLIKMTGLVDQYQGNTYIDPDWDFTTLISQKHEPYDPVVLTCKDIEQTFQADSSEPNEGRLIRINAVCYNRYDGILSDSTDSTSLYIDPDTDLEAPIGIFDLVGILKQYQPSGPPYTSGYEVVPRFPKDIIARNGPQIISGPEILEWRSDGILIGWETDCEATACTYYGQTSFYGDSVLSTQPVTDHRLEISNLDAATVYHYEIFIENHEGYNKSGDRLFITSSDVTSTGEINIYFSDSVNVDCATEYNAYGEKNLSAQLIHRIHTAKYSVDGCFYSFSDTLVQTALVEAQQRGVKIRFIYDSEHDLSDISLLQTANIPIIQNDVGKNKAAGIMHNKFAIFDHRDTTSYSDDWVWTGSYNPSCYPDYPAIENSIEIQDQALAEVYTIEFEEMWGSDGDQPDVDHARFGERKIHNTPHTVMIDGIRFHSLFSPTDLTTEWIRETIQSVDKSLCFCLFSFTREDIAQTILDQYGVNPLLKVYGVFDSLHNVNNLYSQWPTLKNSPAEVFLDGEKGMLHHKYMIVDGNQPTSDPVVITGSHNWSTNAETVNDENTLIIYSEVIANLYLQEFAARFSAAGGDFSSVVGVKNNPDGCMPNALHLLFNFPNPFNCKTRIRYGVPQRGKIRIAIYDLLGREVEILEERWVSPGYHVVEWNGMNRSGKAVTSGVYFIQLSGFNEIQNQKIVLIR